MDPGEVRDRLRAHGLVVHHVVRRKGRDDQLVVFLEGGEGQHEVAALHARGLPGVVEVEFSQETNAIMYLTVTPAS